MSDMTPEREAQLRRGYPMTAVETVALFDELDRLRLALKNEVADRDAAVQAAVERAAIVSCVLCQPDAGGAFYAPPVENGRHKIMRRDGLEAGWNLPCASIAIRSLCTTNALEELLDERARVEFAGGIRVATEELRGGKLHQDHPALVEFKAALERRLLEAQLKTAEWIIHAVRLHAEGHILDLNAVLAARATELRAQLAALDAQEEPQ